MTVTTVYAINDGQIRSSNVSYITASTGGTLSANYTAAVSVGQITGFYVYEGFFEFDTSSIPDEDIVSAVQLQIEYVTDGSVQDFINQVRGYDWGGGDITTASWRTPAQLAALPLLATFNTSGLVTGYNAFVENGANFQNAINKTGYTRIIINSDRHLAQIQPAGNEYVGWWNLDRAAGTAQDPKLVITHGPSGFGPLLSMQRNHLVRPVP